MNTMQRTTLFKRLLSAKVLNSAASYACSTTNTPGSDGQTPSDFLGNQREELKKLREELITKSYKTRPFRQAQIPKVSGGYRIIGVPCVRDRVIGRALVSILNDQFEPLWCNCSHGYRPGRSISTAAVHVADAIHSGVKFAASLDISSFFDTVDHQILISKFDEVLPDNSLIWLIERLVKGQYWETETEPRSVGICQGMPLSPVCANMYLHSFDDILSRYYLCVRYADDVVVLCMTEREARTALLASRLFLRKVLQLSCNPKKCSITSVESGFSYLGLQFKDELISLTPQAKENILLKVEHICKHANDCKDLIDGAKSTIESWAHAYCAVETGCDIRNLASAIFQRLYSRYYELSANFKPQYNEHWRKRLKTVNLEKAHMAAHNKFLRRELLIDA